MNLTTHPSPNLLERFSVDDLPASQRSDTAQHVSSCAPCRLLLDELEAARVVRMAVVPPELFVAQVAERRDRGAVLVQRPRYRLWIGALASAAAAAVLILTPHPSPRIGLKGTGVTIHRNRGGDVRIVGGGETIRAGDALRVVVTLPRPNQVAAWFVDAHGRVDSLLAASPLLLAAGEQVFPGSVTVDSPCVDLQLVLAVGPSAGGHTETALRLAVAHGIPAGDDWLPAGSLVRTLRCE